MSIQYQEPTQPTTGLTQPQKEEQPPVFDPRSISTVRDVIGLQQGQGHGRDGTSLIRAINLQSVIDLVMEEEIIQRPQIAERTGLSLPTVSSLTADLERYGLIVSRGQVQGKMGRPATRYSLNKKAGYIVAVTVEGTNLHAGVSDITGELLAQRTVQTSSGGPDAVVSQIVELHRQLIDQTKFSLQAHGVVSMGFPGQLDPERRKVTDSRVQQFVAGYDLRAQLEQALGIPVVLESDKMLAAIAEGWKGSAQGCRNFVTITVNDEGIGMGIMVDGHPYRGHRNAAGTLAQLPFTLAGVTRGDQQTERFGNPFPAASDAVLTPISPGWEVATQTTATPLALPVDPSRQAELLGLGIATVVSVLDPVMVVLTGDIGSDPQVIEETSRIVERLVPHPPIIKAGRLGQQTTFIGTLALGFQFLQDQMVLRSMQSDDGSARRKARQTKKGRRRRPQRSSSRDTTSQWTRSRHGQPPSYGSQE